MRRRTFKLAVFFILPVLMFGAGEISWVTVQPPLIAAGSDSKIRVTAVLDRKYVQENSVSLLEVDSTGTVLRVLAQMRDDGQNGDEQNGDGVYTAIIARYERLPTTVYLSVSVALQGAFQSTRSQTVALRAIQPGAQAQTINDIAKRLLSTDSIVAQGAVTDMAKGLGLGIYGPGGQQILRGAERGDGDFYFYDLEIPLAAELANEDQLYAIDDVLSDFRLMDIDSAALTNSAALFKVLSNALNQAVASPDDSRSFNLLLVRELGLGQANAYDMATITDPQSFMLTGLQKWLLLADVVLQEIWSYPTVTGAAFNSQPPSGFTVIAPNVQQEAFSGAIRPAAESGASTPSGGGLWGGLKVIRKSIKYAQKINEAAHALLLYRTVELTPDQKPFAFRYGVGTKQQVPASITVKVDVEKLKKLQTPQGPTYAGEVFVYDGPLSGIQMPTTENGGVQNRVSLIWDFSELAPFGDVRCEAECLNTSSNGKATFQFTPDLEAEPLGESTETFMGSISAAIDMGKSFGNDSLVSDLFVVNAKFPFTVTRHIQNWTGYLEGTISSQSDSEANTNLGSGYEYQSSYAKIVQTYRFTANGVSTTTTTSAGDSVTTIPGVFTMPVKLESYGDVYLQTHYSCSKMNSEATHTEFLDTEVNGSMSVRAPANLFIYGSASGKITISLRPSLPSAYLKTDYAISGWSTDTCEGDSQTAPIRFSGVAPIVFPEVYVDDAMLSDGFTSDNQWKYLLSSYGMSDEFSIGEHSIHWHLIQIPKQRPQQP